MSKNKKLTGTVFVEAKKDIPYFKSWDVDEKNKFKLTVEKNTVGITQFEKGKRIKLTYQRAGILAANGFVDILDESKEKVNIKSSK